MSGVTLAIPPCAAAVNTAAVNTAAVTAAMADEPRIVYDENGNAVLFDDLADIRFIKIDQSLPADEKYREYLRQIKNPRLYRYDDTVIRADFSNNGVTLTDRLRQYFYSARGTTI